MIGAEWLADHRPVIAALGTALLVAGSLITALSYRRGRIGRPEPGGTDEPDRVAAPPARGAAPRTDPAAAAPPSSIQAGHVRTRIRPSLAIRPCDLAGAAEAPKRLAGELEAGLWAALLRQPDLEVSEASDPGTTAGSAGSPAATGPAAEPDYVLISELLADGAAWRLAVSLCATATGKVVWSEPFAVAPADRSDDGRLPARIARLVVRALWRVEAMHALAEEQPDVRMLLQRIGYGFAVFGQRKFYEMECCARRAIAIDQDCAAAHGMLAGALALKSYQPWSGPCDEDLGEAFRLAAQAIELSPDDARMLYWAALVHFFGGRSPEAMDLASEAIARSPGFAPAHALLGAATILEGSTSTGLAAIRQALSLAPQHAHAFRFHLWRGIGLAELGNRAPAEQAFRQSLELNPLKDPAASADAYWATLGLAGIHAMQGRTEAARTMLAELQASFAGTDLAVMVERAGRSFAPKVDTLAVVRALSPIWPLR